VSSTTAHKNRPTSDDHRPNKKVIMDTTNRFNHAYSQAPWRVQRQWVSVFLLIVLGFGMIATLYLMVTSQAAIVGREIQDLRLEIMETEHANADLQTELAYLTSKDAVERRAYALGFRPVKPEEVEYLYVPGYLAPKGAMLANMPELQPSAPTNPPEYTQSLLDWLDERLQTPGRGLR
jgi:cell division protein FtsL